MVGKVLSTGFECLYEQCSDQSAEKMPSSVSVGVRPSISTMRPYSSSLRLCSRTTSGVTGRSPGNEPASVAPAAAVELLTTASCASGSGVLNASDSTRVSRPGRSSCATASSSPASSHMPPQWGQVSIWTPW